MRFIASPEIAPKPRQAAGGAQFEPFRPLTAGNVQSCMQMTFDLQCRSPSDLEHLGMKPMELGGHVVLAVRLGVVIRGLQMNEGRFGPAGEQTALRDIAVRLRRIKHPPGFV